MSGQLGRLLLVKVGDGADPEVFANLCGLTSKGVSINNAEIDVTTPDCANPGGPLTKATLDGIQTVSVSGSARFQSSDQHAELATAAFDQVRRNYQVGVPGWGVIQAEFRMVDINLEGAMDGDLTASFTLESSGPVTFTAEA